MTDEIVSLRGRVEKSAEAEVLVDIIGIVAKRLMKRERGTLTGVASDETNGEPSKAL